MPLKISFLLITNIFILCSTTISDIILNDLRNAFRMIANDTQQLNRILHQMYELENISPKISFNLPFPMKNGSKQIQMLHMNFSEPTFPNLTTTYINNMHNKWKYSNTPEDWTILGLQGWEGSISRPIEIKTQIVSDYPTEDILAALNNNQEEDSQKQLLEYNNDDVYIARANHPFGYSTKWMPKNHENVDRSKRGIPALYSMIKCSTSCDPIIFQGYGCFCGFLGRGQAQDSTDRCCQHHDKCYGQSKCVKFIEYFVPYLWKCYYGKPICATNHGIWGDSESCAARLCKCDLQLSNCLRKQVCPQRRSICSSSRQRRLENFLFVK